jgi:plastocyanin
MKIGSCLLIGALLLGPACSREERDTAADRIRESAEEAVEEGREAAKEAADRAEDVINDRTVRIDDLAFDPETRTVTVGTEVTWINRDSVSHTVTADNGSFDSGEIDPDEEFSFRFTQAGTYRYHCEVHGRETMSGAVVVE